MGCIPKLEAMTFFFFFFWLSKIISEVIITYQLDVFNILPGIYLFIIMTVEQSTFPGKLDFQTQDLF